jgi:uncharacterized protein (TIGR03382 family)
MRRLRWIGLLGLLLPFWVACQPQAPEPAIHNTRSQAVIYGKDDRIYTADHPDKKLQALADAVTIQVYSSSVKTDSKTGEVTLSGSNFTTRVSNSSRYGKLPLCADEPFRLDRAPGGCTGFLIGKKLLATAGHCVSKTSPISAQSAQYWCNNRKFVFGFRKGRKLHKDDVVGCKRVLVHAYTSKPKEDIAVIELDREIQGITPVELDKKPGLAKGDGVAIIGHPHGTFQKIAAGGKVTDPRSSTLDYFRTSLDTMPGNSGSPVFSMKTYKVIAVHVRGRTPAFVADKDKKCNRTNVFSEDKGSQGENYLTTLEPKACKQTSDCTTHQDCVSGRCQFKTADLVLKDVKLITDKATRGVPLSISYTIEYKGTYAATKAIRVGLWWSSNSTLCATCGQDKVIKTILLKDLKPGKVHKGSFSFEAQPYFRAGKQYVGIYVDDYRDSTKKPSWNGNVYESDENNNKQTVAFTLETCKSDCAKAGELRCQGQDIQICNKQPSGCLLWELQDSCKATEVCEQGQCKAKCTDSCPKADDTRCKDDKVEVCKEQASGCLDWQQDKSCDGTEVCKEGACVSKKSEGETCAADGDCLSGKCEKNGDSGQCRQPCSAAKDCDSSITGPWCESGLCNKIPKGSCLEDNDCDSGQDCVKNQCKKSDDGKKPDDKTPTTNTGCQCSAASSTPPASFAFLFLFLLIFRRRSFRE